MPLNEERVREQLKLVIDPELFVNIVDLGLIYGVELAPADAPTCCEQPAAVTAPAAPAEATAELPRPEVEGAHEHDRVPGTGCCKGSAFHDQTHHEGAGACSTTPLHTIGAEEVPARDTKVMIEMTMTSPMCPAGPQLIADCKRFVGQLPEIAAVEVRLVMDPPWTPDRMTEDARDQLGIF